MKKIFILIFCIFSLQIIGQKEPTSTTFFKPYPENFTVKHALEVESLVPMFFTGGYHFAVGYRFKRFRIRASVINGGTYNAERAGVNNSSNSFKRYYTTSPGLFLGYNIWRNLELYTYLEFHTFAITQRSTQVVKNLKSIDSGLGISYQIFIGRYFYIQPGFHFYVRAKNSLVFPGETYQIPTKDFSVVLRLGVRLWRKY